MRLIKTLLGTLALAFLFGCAHPITMAPDLAAIEADGAPRIEKSVAFHVPDSVKALEVTTAGGGGDKVRYFPYRDLEAGIYLALSEVFRSVSKAQNPADRNALASAGVTLVITPEITTASSSESLFTWPPTQFTVNLSCKIVNADGQTVDTVKVSGYGTATFDEFKSNFSLAAVRASNHALSLLMPALRASVPLRR